MGSKPEYYREYNRQYYLDTRWKMLEKKYGLTKARYEAMLTAQNHACAICKRAEISGDLFTIDHDHACCPGAGSCGSCIRGLLCAGCNQGLGSFRDDTGSLTHAVQYLLDYESITY